MRFHKNEIIEISNDGIYSIGYIYALLHPIELYPIYVGKTFNPLERLVNHRSTFKGFEPHKRNPNIKKLKMKILEAIEDCEDMNALSIKMTHREDVWIARLRRKFDLLNVQKNSWSSPRKIIPFPTLRKDPLAESKKRIDNLKAIGFYDQFPEYKGDSND